MLAPSQVKNYQFQLVGDGLYRADEVDAYFGTVGSAYEKLYNENGDMLKRISMLAEKVKSFQEEEELIKKTLLVAQKKADEIEAAANQYSETSVAAADKRSKDLMAAAEDRARTALADANRKSAATLKGASETAEKTIASAKSKAAMVLGEAKVRAEKMLADAQAKQQEILGSLKSEAEREKKALESVRAQSKAFKKQLLDSYYQQIGMTENKLDFIEQDDSIAETAVRAAADAAPVDQEPIRLPEQAVEDVQIDLPVVEEPTYDTTEDDDLFISTFAETVEDEPAPAEAPAAEPEEDAGGFSFVRSYDDIAPQKAAEPVEDIPEVELANIDEIFSSALSEPAPEAPQEPEFDFVNPFEELKDKYKAEPQPAEDFSSRMQSVLPDETPDEPTQKVSLGAVKEDEADEKPEKKHHKFSLFSRYEDDDE
ncbi:MAG: DivIVA domain-containing protein, partial [Clostridia bacterium]|nr:DivIVA domain-containing protein [Clostridia bacterium]